MSHNTHPGLRLRVASAAVESRLRMSSGALPGPDLLVMPGVLCRVVIAILLSREARGARVELGGGFRA